MRKVHHYPSLIGEAGSSAEDHKVATFSVTLEELKSGVTLPANQRHVIRLRPKPGLLRLAGMFFDTNKNFVLPVSIASLVKVVELYKRRPESKVLIVGHTDTSGQVEYNDTLSLERAEAMAAYLTDDVSAWLARYESSVSSEKRWGSAEDLMMIAALPEGESEETDPVRKFQDTRSLAVDGIAGPKTRAAIIGEYMARDGTTLPSTCSIVLHGCGEHFPLTEDGRSVDQGAADDADDPLDRRVELFFFEPEITPPPPGTNSSAGSPEYQKWCEQSVLLFEMVIGPPRQLRVRLQANGEPLQDEQYELRVDGVLIAAGTTKAQGLVTHLLPHGCAVAELVVPRLGLRRSLDLMPAETFPPVSDDRGVQIRLNQLGFHCGTVDGSFGPVTQDALAHFNEVHGLPGGRNADAATRQKLKEEYGS